MAIAVVRHGMDWLAMTVAGAPSNALRKATQRRRSTGGGGGGGPQKWGHNNDNDEYDADDAASAVGPTINLTITMAARGGGAAAKSDRSNGNNMGPQQ